MKEYSRDGRTTLANEGDKYTLCDGCGAKIDLLDFSIEIYVSENPEDDRFFCSKCYLEVEE